MSSHKDVEPPIYGYIAEFDHPEMIFFGHNSCNSMKTRRALKRCPPR